MSEPTRPVLRYFGGKWRLAPWIISHFPPHRVYVEPFGGAASVLIRKPRAYAEVYNDLDSEVVNVFRVLQDPSKAASLWSLLSLTPFSREEFELSYVQCEEPIERARRTFIRAYMGFGSNGHNSKAKTGFRSNSNRSGTTPAHDWSSFHEQIPKFTERLSGVVIENRDATEVLLAHDSPESLHFVDPPYVHETRSKHRYSLELTNADHEALCETLSKLEGMVILCGYETPIYSTLGWTKETREAHADGAEDRTEVLWLNPAARKHHAQVSFNLEGA